jgi:hypothetical protein
MHFIGLAGLPGVITPTQIFHYLMIYRMLMFDDNYALIGGAFQLIFFI